MDQPRRPDRLWLPLGALAGMAAVALGAFAAHGLQDDAYAAGLLDKGSRYQMYHALALVAVGLLQARRPSRLLDAAGAAFVLGILLFCGALYAIALFKLRAGMVAPFGGASFMLGWLLLAVSSIRRA